VEHLVHHALERLSSDAESDKDKRSAADDCLRIAGISRIFRPELAPRLDRLSQTCKTVLRGDRRTKNHCTSSTFSMDLPSENRPDISIGMTIYNQQPFLAKTIESILGQEFSDFELYIIDNASEDRSIDICERYAQADRRIRIVKNKFNIGRVASFDQVLKHCCGEYFMWSSGHDLYHRYYLRRFLEKFNACDDSVALVVPGAAMIDENDNLIRKGLDHLPDTQGMPVVERYQRIIWNFRPGSMSGCLFRRALLNQVWEPFTVRGPMYVIAARLSLLGAVAHVNDTLFFKRMTDRYDTAGKSPDPHVRTLSIRKSEAAIPYTMLAFEHIDMVRRSRLEPSEKTFLYEEIKKCFVQRFNLNDEALAFLKEGVEIVREISKRSEYPTQNMTELTNLSNVCSFFHNENQHVFERFNQLLLQMTPN
jgi:glycosyltransferase involved in cell wall biosynthesis